MSTTKKNSILVLGDGELENAILDSFLEHPQFSKETTPLTLLVRPSSLNSDAPDKKAQYDQLRERSINLVPGDIDLDSQESLAKIFAGYNTIIQAAGMTSPPGTHLKVTHAILEAGVEFYIPWQHGVNYDAIGRDGGFGLFTEQIDVRDLLRSQSKTHWTVISCGIFMSFIFEEFWGVVTKQADGKIKVTALNSWDDWITTTTARDIGRCSAELVLSDRNSRDNIIYIAGDTLKYSEFADAVQMTTGKEVIREVWPLEYLKEEARKDPENKLKKYHVVFSEGTGLSWPKENTWSAKRGMDMEDVATWISKNWI